MNSTDRFSSSRIFYFYLILVSFIFCVPGFARGSVPLINPTVISQFPHDNEAFTQGLLFHDGFLYESTGLYGESTLRQTEITSGTVVRQVELPDELFGEGLTRINERLIQITWKEQRALVYAIDSFEVINEYTYEGEGWGLTFDGDYILMTSGDHYLQFRDPFSFELVQKLPVTLNGRPLARLNELEFIEGNVYANIWGEDFIARIDPQTGQVTSLIDCRKLIPAASRQRENVLNGIAWDQENRLLYITGKNWPSLFAVSID